MDEIACNISQFDLENGATSCMAASMCAARLFLEKDLTRADLERVLKAGATVYTRWTTTTGSTCNQCWKDVVNVVPRYLEQAFALYEANGVFGADTRSACTSLYGDVFDACAADARHTRVAGVITANGGSYMIAKDADYWYCFDPHGAYGLRDPSNPTGGATLRRSRDRAAMQHYLQHDVMSAPDNCEFHAVLFAGGKKPSAAADSE